MLDTILDFFKENGLVAVFVAAVTALYASLFKGDSRTSATWRKVGIAITIASMILGIYWVPAQSLRYLVLGLGIVCASCVLNARDITYTRGKGLAVQSVQLTTAGRITAFLPAVWAPFIMPTLQWFLHETIPDFISKPGVANPIFHLLKSVSASLAVSAVLIACTLLVDHLRLKRETKEGQTGD